MAYVQLCISCLDIISDIDIISGIDILIFRSAGFLTPPKQYEAGQEGHACPHRPPVAAECYGVSFYEYKNRGRFCFIAASKSGVSF